MELHRSDSAGLNLVKLLDSGEFVVNEVLYTQSIIVTVDNVITDWSAQSVADLSTEHFRMFAQFDPEILILGTGKNLHFPDRRFLNHLCSKGVDTK